MGTEYPYIGLTPVTLHYGYTYEKFDGVWLHVLWRIKKGEKDGYVTAYTRRSDVIRECKYLEKLNQDKFEHLCPICKYEIPECQCRFGGSSHPDRSKRKEVVKDHLYLLTEKQIEHLIALERQWQTSYGDDEKNEIVTELKNDFLDGGGILV